MGINVFFTGPERQVLETFAGTWHLLADRKVLPEELPDPREAKLDWSAFGDRFEELTAVFLPFPEASNLPCQAFRSLLSGYELFRVETPEGDVVLTDDFKFAAKAAGKRKTSETSLLDYLLFQYPAGNDTFLPGVSRLGAGEALLEESRETSGPVFWQAERFRLPCEASFQEALETLHRVLPDAVNNALQGAADTAVLFSGGIDSTLIAHFARGRSVALHAAIDSAELDYEEDYARSACRELEMPLVRVLFSESGFLSELEDTVEKMGRPFPVTNFQAIFHNRLFRLPYSLYLSGDIADRLFGKGNEAAPSGIESPASGLVRYCPVGLLKEIFGPDLVESRLRLFDETLERVAGPEGERYPAALKTDLLIVFGLNYWVHFFRPLAAVYGKKFVAPYQGKKVFEAAFSCRYRNRLPGTHSKPLLWAMLRDLLPGYPASGKKGGSGVPRTRFCQTGPMKDFFLDHDLPSGIPRRFERIFREPRWETSALVLQAAVYRIWEERL